MRTITTAVALAVVLLAGCGDDSGDAVTTTTLSEEEIAEGAAAILGDLAPDPIHEELCPGLSSVHVVYFVEGTTTEASLTMERTDGTEQITVRLPLESRDGTPGVAQCSRAGDFLYISAQNQKAAGSVVCRIEADGNVISENRSSGAYVIAQCDGSA